MKIRDGFRRATAAVVVAALFTTACDLGSGTMASSHQALSSADPTGGDPTRDDPTGGTVGGGPGLTPGTLPGKVSVNADGAMRYSIPIAVPPAANDFVPSISLEYNSNLPTGALGMGWALVGLSRIHRCAKDLVRDGELRAIEGVDSDALCMDGKRMVPLQPWMNGKPDAEYRLETDDKNLRIIGRYSSSQPNSYFEVYEPGGTVLRLGATYDSRIQHSGWSPTVWALSDAKDRFGNTISYFYTSDKDDPQWAQWAGWDHRLTGICYGYNRAAGTRCSRRVDFEYQSHTSSSVDDNGMVTSAPQFITQGYRLGGRHGVWHHLSAIKTSVGSQLVNTYSLTYSQYNPAFLHTLILERVQVCDPNAVCMAPTVFKWHVPEEGFSDLPLMYAGADFKTRPDGMIFDGEILRVQGDFDGDHKTDFLVAPLEADATWLFWPSGQNGIDKPIDTGIPAHFRDLYATKKGGLVIPSTAYDSVVSPLSTSFNWYDPVKGRQAAVISLMPALDLSGLALSTVTDPSDGRANVGDLFQVLIANGNGTFQEKVLDDGVANPILGAYLGDLDGNGLEDLIYCRSVVDPSAGSPADDVQWMAGKWYFTLHQPGVGFNFAEEQGGEISCGLRDLTYGPIDTDGDGDSELLYISGNEQTGAVRAFDQLWPTYRSLSLVNGQLTALESPLFLPADVDARVDTNGAIEDPHAPLFGPGPGRFLDLNSDGLADFFGGLTLYTSTGAGFEQRWTFTPSKSWGDKTFSFYYTDVLRSYDYDGDQHPDFLVDAYYHEIWEQDYPHPGPLVKGKITYLLRGKPDGFRVEQLDEVANTLPPEGPSFSTVVNSDVDGQEDWLTGGVGSPAVLQVHNGGRAGAQIEQVINGLEERTRITYAPLAGVHVESGGPVTYPLEKEPHEGPVVTLVYNDTGLVDDDGAAGMWWWRLYQYENFRYDHLRGNLGFEYRTVVSEREDENGEVWRTKDYERYRKGPLTLGLYPQARLLTERLTVTENLNGAKRTIGTISRGTSTSVQTSSQRTLRTDLISTYKSTFESTSSWNEQNRRCFLDSPGCALTLDNVKTTSWTKTDYLERDSFGNALKTRTTSMNGGETIVERTVHNETASGWYLGNVLHEKVSHKTSEDSNSQLNEFRESHNYYYPNWTLHWRDNEPNRPKYRNSVVFEYDTFGNVKKKTRTSPQDWGSQWEGYTYTGDGAFLATTTNAKGHSTSTSWDARCGLATESVDIAGRRTVTAFDGFCRPTESQSLYGNAPLAPKTFTQYQRINDGLATRTRIRSWADGNDASITDLDRLGRTVRSEYPVFNGVRAQVTSVYGASGQVIAASLPDALDAPETAWTHFEYDGLNRLIKTTTPDWKESRTEYDGNESRTYDPLGHMRKIIKDGRGRVVRSEEPKDADPAKNADMCYAYGAFGRLLYAEPCSPSERQARVTFLYDAYNRIEDIIDKKMGRRCKRYDEFGRAVLEKDASGHPELCQHDPAFVGQTTFGYDELDRVTSRIDADGPKGYVYDVEAPGALYETNTSTGYIERIHLDPLKRPRSVEQIFPDAKTFMTRTEYDTRGRVQSIDFPRVHANVPFQIRYEYDANDVLGRIVDQSTNQPLWMLTAMSARGQITSDAFFNGTSQSFVFHPSNGRLMSSTVFQDDDELERWTYDYNDDGTMASRKHWDPETATHLQTFGYDAKQRMTLAHLWPLGVSGLCNGNDCGQQAVTEYDAFGNIESRSDVGTYVYSNERLDRVEKTTPANALVTYNYDVNGNMRQRDDDGIITELEYTPSHMPKTLSGPNADFTFLYDASDRKVQEKNLMTGRTTYYAGATELTTGGDMSEGMRATYNVTTPSGATVSVSRAFKDPTSPTYDGTMHVAHKDKLGSTTLITDEAGAAYERRAYDPWGRNLEPLTWTPTVVLESSAAYNGGFTGHEAREYAGLINMQARMYDPVIGRFIEADTVIPDGAALQSWNRYSYVINSPLNYTDPTGHRYESTGCVSTGVFIDCGGGGGFYGYGAAAATAYGAVGIEFPWDIIPDSELDSPSRDGWTGNDLMQQIIAAHASNDRELARMRRERVTYAEKLFDADYVARAAAPVMSEDSEPGAMVLAANSGGVSDMPAADASRLEQTTTRGYFGNLVNWHATSNGGYMYRIQWDIGPVGKARTAAIAMFLLQLNPNRFFPFVVEQTGGPRGAKGITLGGTYVLIGTRSVFIKDKMGRIQMSPLEYKEAYTPAWKSDRAGVEVIEATANSFKFRTLPDHFDKGTIEFRTFEDNGRIILQHIGYAPGAPCYMHGYGPFNLPSIAAWSHMASALDLALDTWSGTR
ncbi:MAG: hypothetical protein HOV81_16425 [Kofleriaceae bacterium]|nr:hypothetical protein [Kofleriaceae bacterium]